MTHRDEPEARRPRRAVLTLGVLAAASLSGCSFRQDPATTSATNDGQLASILASARAGDEVVLQPTPGGYTLDGGLVVPAGVHLVGKGAVVRPGRRMPFLLRLEGDASVEDVQFEAGDLVSRGVVQVHDGARGARIRGCTVDGGLATRLGVEIGGATGDVTVESCVIRDARTGLSVAQGFEGVRIQGVSVTGWSQRGIYVLSSDVRSSGLTIDSCTVSDLRAGGTSRYPISVTGTQSGKIEDVTIRGCVVHGPGRPWIDASDPGTADQIAVRHAETVLVSGNESTGGGDMGITIAHCSGASIEGNTCRDNDASGIWVGTRPGSTMGRVEVVGNTVTDNGRNRTGQRPDDTLAGIRLVNATDVVVTGNTVGNTDAVMSERHGISARASSLSEVRDNTARGLGGRIVYDSSLGTDAQAD